MDPDQMDRDYQRARREEEQRLVQKAMLDLMVGRGGIADDLLSRAATIDLFQSQPGFPDVSVGA
jgi:hypothetical protein